MKRLYILYDERAAMGDTTKAMVLSCDYTLKGIKEDLELFPNAICYSYKDNGKELVDERREWI